MSSMINISIYRLIEGCSLGVKTDMELISDFRRLNRENVHEVFGYRKFNDDFSEHVTVYNDDNSVIGIIKPSYKDFIISISRALGIKSLKGLKDDREFTRLLNDRVKLLESIKTVKELKKNFPRICNDYGRGIEFLDQIIYVEENEKLSDLEKKGLEEDKKYYYRCALRRKIEDFTKYQSILYDRLVNRRFDYKKKIEGLSYNTYLRKYYNIDKIAMLVVSDTLSMCEIARETDEIRKYLPTIEKYIDSDYNKNVRVTIGNQTITYDSIVERFNKIKERLGNFEKVDWELIPEPPAVIKANKQYDLYKNIISSKKLTELRQKGLEKEKFYEESNYLLKVIGTNEHGYAGYIYDNGQVVVDYQFDYKNPVESTGNAAYIMDSINFEWFSRLDKETLRTNPKVTRVIHSKHWKKKIEDIINKEGTEEEQEAAKELVKRLKEKE